MVLLSLELSDSRPMCLLLYHEYIVFFLSFFYIYFFISQRKAEAERGRNIHDDREALTDCFLQVSME